MTSIPLRFNTSCIALALAASWCLGCGQFGAETATSGDEQPRLVVLYAPCSVSKQFLSPYNSKITYTPNIESFSREATVFEKHRTEAGLSGIAYASILTGNQAPNHGVFAHPTELADSIYDLTEAFADNGYEVFFWNHQRMGAADLNYAQGTQSDRVFNRFLKSDDSDLSAILRRVSTDRSYRAFVLVNFSVTHSPYEAKSVDKFLKEYPEEKEHLAGISDLEVAHFSRMFYEHLRMMKYDFERFRQEQDLDESELDKLVRVVELLYKANIPRLDSLFGQLLNAIDSAGLSEESLVALTADHGETLYNPHAPFKWSHGHALQADVLDVPLMIRVPKSTRFPGRCSSVTRSIDLYPTLVSLARLGDTANIAVEGYDLSKLMQPNYVDPDLLAFSHTGMVFPAFKEPEDVQNLLGSHMSRYYPGPDMKYTWVSVRKGNDVWKYRPVERNDPEFQAFDLLTDPDESKNIFNPADPIDREMSNILTQYKKDLITAYREWGSARAQGLLDKNEQLERLRSMGYIK